MAGPDEKGIDLHSKTPDDGLLCSIQRRDVQPGCPLDRGGEGRGGCDLGGHDRRELQPGKERIQK